MWLWRLPEWARQEGLNGARHDGGSARFPRLALWTVTRVFRRVCVGAAGRRSRRFPFFVCCARLYLSMHALVLCLVFGALARDSGAIPEPEFLQRHCLDCRARKVRIVQRS